METWEMVREIEIGLDQIQLIIQKLAISLHEIDRKEETK